MSLSLKKDILAPATTWMNLEGIVRSERDRSQKDKYYVIPLAKVVRGVGSQKRTAEWGLPGAGRRAEIVCDGHRISSGEDAQAPEMDDGDGCTTRCLDLMLRHELCTCKWPKR